MSIASDSVPAYNESEPWGGNPLEVDVNAQYTGFEYHYTYLVFCGFIVWIIIPGIGLLYGGLARRKSALALLFQSFMVAAVTTVQWMFWGFSLAYSRTAGPFIGDLSNFLMRGVLAAPSWGSPEIRDIVNCLYQYVLSSTKGEYPPSAACQKQQAPKQKHSIHSTQASILCLDSPD